MHLKGQKTSILKFRQEQNPEETLEMPIDQA